jgi:CRP-like cAMP-binding protein
MDHLIELIGHYIPGADDVLEKVAPYIKERRVQKNDFVLQADGVCRKVCFISKGACIMYRRDKDGNEEVTDFQFEGTLTGDYVSFIEQKPSEHYIKALEDCLIDEISYEDLNHLYKTLPLLERAGRILSEQIYCKVITRMTSYQNDTPEVRYQQLLEQNPMLFQRVPQYLIASFLGVTPVGLSKIRKRLHDNGPFIKRV